MLPTTTSSVRPVSNSLSKIAVVNYFVLATVLWCLLSLCAIVGGIYHCRANAYSYDVVCDAAASVAIPHCVFSSSFPGSETRRIARDDITDVSVVRINKAGEEVDTNGMRHRQMTRLGSTMRLTYKVRAGNAQLLAGGATTHDAHDAHEGDYEMLDGGRIRTATLLFPPVDMGGNVRPAKSGRRKLDEYISRKDDKAVKLSNGKAVTIVGVLCILGGIFSTILSCLMGTWADKKVSYRRPGFAGVGAGPRKRRD